MKKTITALILTLSMLLSLTVVPVYAAETTVTTEEALVDAINNASEGDVIKVADNIDIEAMITIPEDKDITVDLGGNTLSTVDVDATVIYNLGTLTVTNGTIEASRYCLSNPTAKSVATVDGVVMTSGDGFNAIYNHGALTVNNSTVNGSWNGITNLKYLYDEDYEITSENEDNIVKVTNSTIIGKNGWGGIYNEEGTVVVGEGSNDTSYITGYYSGISNLMGSVTINGGTFDNTAEPETFQYDVDDAGSTAAIMNYWGYETLKINDGTFNGHTNSIYIAYDEAEITINNGTFNKDIASYYPASYLTVNNGIFNGLVTGEYETTIKDGTFNGGIYLDAQSDITIEGGTFTGTAENPTIASKEGNLTINGGNFHGGGSDTVFALNYNIIGSNKVRVNINGGTFTSTDKIMRTNSDSYNGSRNASFIAINGGDFEGTSITGATINGYDSLTSPTGAFDFAYVTVKDGEYENASFENSTLLGGTYDNVSLTGCSVEGGIFNSITSIDENLTGYDETEITGGTFNAECLPVIQDYLPERYFTVENADGTIGILKGEYSVAISIDEHEKMMGFPSVNKKYVNTNDEVTFTTQVHPLSNFVGWYDGDTLVSTEKVYTTNAITKNTTLTAKYEPAEAVAAWYNENKDNTEITIDSEDEMLYLAYAVNYYKDSMAGKTIKLTRDLDFTGKSYIPIGGHSGPLRPYIEYPFEGIFDGQNHVITNIVMEYNPNLMVSCIGIFGAINGKGEVKNLHLKDCKFEGSYAVGSIAGDLIRGAKISNCTVTDLTVAYESGGWHTGGVVGHIYAGTVENVVVANVEVGATHSAGGVTGHVEGGPAVLNNVTVKNVEVYDYVEGGAAVGRMHGTIEMNNIRVIDDEYKEYWKQDNALIGSLDFSSYSDMKLTIGGSETSVDVYRLFYTKLAPPEKVVIEEGTFNDTEDVKDYIDDEDVIVEEDTDEDGDPVYVVKKYKADVIDTDEEPTFKVTLNGLEDHDAIDTEKNAIYEVELNEPSAENNIAIPDNNTEKIITDISVKVTDKATGESETVQGVTDQPVTITLNEKIKDGTTPKVYKIENGVATEITEITVEGNAISFTADTMGTYAVTYTQGDYTEDELTDQIILSLEPTETKGVFDIVANAVKGKVINRLTSSEMTFTLTNNGEIADTFVVEPASYTTMLFENGVYEFNMDHKTVDMTGDAINLGQVKVYGYGDFELDVVGIYVNATKVYNNIFDTYSTESGTLTEDRTYATRNTIGKTGDPTVPAKVSFSHEMANLTVNIAFPNKIEANAADYQKMTLTIDGEQIPLGEELLTDANGDVYYTVTRELIKNTPHHIVVEGDGYRTARYSVSLTEDKTVNFWNNVMTNAEPMEVAASGATKNNQTANFLAGDIVKDNDINLYDLSAVVSYFGKEGMTVADDATYIQYDLNRDGKINSKDIAMVLVSWDN